jgi:anti-sigma factor RsiW
MDCNQLRTLAPRFLENALAERERQAVEAHVDACPACQAALEHALGVPALKAHATYYRAPAALRERIAPAIAHAGESEPPPRRQPFAWKLPEWLKLGLVSLATAVVMIAFLLPMRATVADDATADALIASHVRWSRLDKLIDVPTSDRHTVKPWLSQKLGYSPLVPDLKAEGFQLVGGRLDYVRDRFVGTVVYKRRDHVIDVYVWPAEGHAGERRSMSHNGYHVVQWTLGDMAYWAVSDLNEAELEQFADLYAHAT